MAGPFSIVFKQRCCDNSGKRKDYGMGPAWAPISSLPNGMSELHLDKFEPEHNDAFIGFFFTLKILVFFLKHNAHTLNHVNERISQKKM